MVSLDVNDAVMVEQRQVLEQALSTNPKTQKALQKLIRKVIMEARAKVVDAADRAMKSDPRETQRAVRTTVYKQILGANINIYNSRKAHGTNSYEPQRKGTSDPSGRGGNRLKRSPKTQRMMSYAPLDRGMILRWINTGVSERTTRYGKRGSISARNFFRNAGERALVQAADNLANLIDTELENILNKKK